MKKNGNILRYPIMLVMFIAISVVLDKLFGDSVEETFWYYCMQGVAFAIALLLGDVAEKHGWDTWSGLIGKFKKKSK